MFSLAKKIVPLLLVIVGCCVGYLAYEGHVLDKSSKAYVDEAIPAIVTSWLPHELLKRESSAFLKATSDAQLMQLFVDFRRIGALQSYEGCKGEANIKYTLASGKMITAAYSGQAIFQNGKAEIKVLLIQQNGEWKIQGFRIESPLFMKIVL